MSFVVTTYTLSHSISPTSLIKRYAGLGLIAAMMLCTTFSAWAHTTSLTMQNAWIRGSVPGQKNGAAYIQINNGGNHEMVLESISSDRADQVELHTVDRENGVARMREVGALTIGAHANLKMAPGGYHIMLIGLKEPFKAGETVTLHLNFKGYDPVPVEFKVMPPTYQPSGQAAPAHSGHQHSMSH